MADEGKALLLKTAADVGKYYAFVGQALRSIHDPASAAQLPAGALDAQIDQVRQSLAPALETNHVVKQNFADVDARLADIRKTKSVDQAKQFGSEIQERAKVVSDLVALFRRL